MNRRVVLILAAVLMGACASDLERARAGDRSLTGANLHGADLHGANLFGTDLIYADLRDANLSDANLTGAALIDVRCNAETRWPAGFTPPTCAP